MLQKCLLRFERTIHRYLVYHHSCYSHHGAYHRHYHGVLHRHYHGDDHHHHYHVIFLTSISISKTFSFMLLISIIASNFVQQFKFLYRY